MHIFLITHKQWSNLLLTVAMVGTLLNLRPLGILQTATSNPVDAATESTTPNIANSPSAQVMLTGRIIPTVNTGPESGIGADPKDTNKLLLPVEYHLCDVQG